MTHKSNKVWMLVLSLFIASLAACGTSNKVETLQEQVKDRGELKLAVYQYQPFSGLDNGEWTGIFADVTKELADRMDLKIDTTVLTPTGYITSLSAGRVDAVVGVSRTDERAAVADFTTPILYAPDAIAVGLDSTISNVGDLDGKKIAVTRGAWSETLAGILIDSGKMKPAKVLKYESYEATLLEVSNGRADAAIADVIGVQYALSQNSKLRLKSVPIPPKDEGVETFDPMYYVVSRKTDNKAFIGSVNKHLADMKDDGTLDRVFKAHGLEEFVDELLTGS